MSNAGVNLALEHLRHGRLTEADGICRKILAKEPDHSRALWLLGTIASQAGRHGDAIALIGRAISIGPRDAQIFIDLGNAYHMSGQIEESLACYDKALEIQPASPDAFVNRGVALQRLGRIDESLSCVEQLLKLQPDNAGAYNNRGLALKELGKLEEALGSFGQALAIDGNLAEAHNNRGNVLKELARIDEALASYGRAIEIAPAFVDAWSNRALALKELGQFDNALASYDRAIELRPNHADIHYGRGVVLNLMGRMNDALASYHRAIALKPQYVQARFAWCIAQLQHFYAAPGEIAGSRARYEAALAVLCSNLELDTPSAIDDASEAVGSAQPFYLAYQGFNDKVLQSRFGQMVCQVMQAWLRQLPTAPRPSPAQASGRIRVGVVTGQLRRHSVWDVLTRGLLLGLDGSNFELVGYHTTMWRDAETDLAERKFIRLVQGPLPIKRWLEIIVKDSPDVLIYPEIGMDPTAAKLAAMRLAPVQIAMWGHPETTGLPTMDYFLSGELLEPLQAHEHYSEKLVCLPNLGCCFSRMPTAQAHFDLQAHGISGDKDLVRFLCCQSVFKYLPQYDEIFPRIAKAVVNCRFVFVRFRHLHLIFARFYRRLEAAFSAAGLDAKNFCIVIDELPRAEFFSLMTQMDVYLDTISFSGFTSAFQALQCGLPIVTVEGEFMRGRLGSAILHRARIPETIARDVDHYVDIGTRLARDPAWRSAVRKRISANVSRIFDDPAPLRALEEFLTLSIRGR